MDINDTNTSLTKFFELCHQRRLNIHFLIAVASKAHNAARVEICVSGMKYQT